MQAHVVTISESELASIWLENASNYDDEMQKFYTDTTYGAE